MSYQFLRRMEENIREQIIYAKSINTIYNATKEDEKFKFMWDLELIILCEGTGY